jgi:hypothetical protein
MCVWSSRKALAEQTGIVGSEDLIQLCMGDTDMTHKTGKTLDYFLVTDEPWFVRTPVEVSIAGFVSDNAKRQRMDNDAPQINVCYIRVITTTTSC